MNSGWIYLHRKLLDCSIWTDNEPYDRRSAWIDLLLLANHSDKTIIFDGQKMVITRGQYLTSVRKLSERWHWGNHRTLNYLRLLEELEMIHRESNTKRTLITVVNYGIYQVMGNTHSNTDSNTHDNTDSNTHSPQTINDNKLNKLNKKRESFTPPTVEEVKAYCQERNNNVNPQSFVDFYQSKGWKVGSNSMKDWKACVRTWEQREKKEKPQNKFNNFSGRQYDTDSLERALLGGGS